MVDATEVLEQAEKERDQLQDLLRPVAEFFHDHEGELFERYEAIEELQDHLDTDDERLIAKVMGNLCADRVDPVQNVVKDGENWIGVIEYHEHDYWYEYVEHNDVEGRLNIGVCAKCVKEADADTEVAKGVGTTEELADRIEDHYDEEHDGTVEVETGATLNSGTTIAGNTAIHSANDGLGSNLDADLLRGTQGSGYVFTNVAYSEEILSGGVEINNFSSGSNPEGVGVDSSDSVWVVVSASSPESIIEYNQSGTSVSGFSAPNSGSSGLGFDSNDSMWHADNDADTIYEIDQSGSVKSQFSTPSGSPNGVGLDSNDSIWHADSNAGSIFKLDQSGTQLSSFSSNGPSAQGVGVDDFDSIWHADYSNESIYEYDASGSLLSQFSSPSSPRGVGVDSDNRGWIAQLLSSNVYNYSLSEQVKYE